MIPAAKTKRHARVIGNMLTPTQADVLIFCWDFYRENDQLPPRAVVCKEFGFASWNAAQEHLTAIERKGWLERNAVGKFKFSKGARWAMEHAEYTESMPRGRDSPQERSRLTVVHPFHEDRNGTDQVHGIQRIQLPDQWRSKLAGAIAASAD